MSYRIRLAGIAAGILATTTAGAALALPGTHVESSVAASFTAQANLDLSASQQAFEQGNALIERGRHAVSARAEGLYAKGGELLLKASNEVDAAAKTDAHVTGAMFPSFAGNSASIVADFTASASGNGDQLQPVVKTMLQAIDQQLATAKSLASDGDTKAEATLNGAKGNLDSFAAQGNAGASASSDGSVSSPVTAPDPGTVPSSQVAGNVADRMHGVVVKHDCEPTTPSTTVSADPAPAVTPADPPADPPATDPAPAAAPATPSANVNGSAEASGHGSTNAGAPGISTSAAGSTGTHLNVG